MAKIPKINLHMKEVMKDTTLIVNLKGYRVWLIRKKLAMIFIWIASRLLWVKFEIKE